MYLHDLILAYESAGYTSERGATLQDSIDTIDHIVALFFLMLISGLYVPQRNSYFFNSWFPILSSRHGEFHGWSTTLPEAV